MTTTITPASELPYQAGAHFGEGSDTAITVAAASNSVIREIDIILGASTLFFQVKNVHASVAFDEFVIQRRTLAAGAWETIANAAGDYSSPQVPILEVQGAPVTLAAAASVFIRMDVEATDAVRILASGNAAASTADLFYGIQ